MTIQPPNSHDTEALHELFARTFSSYWTWHDYATDGYFDGAPYDWNASRVARVDGELASHFGVWDFSMRIGSAAVRVAAIGAVTTHRPLRTHGLMKQTASEAVGSFRELGYDMSLLFGIQRYYLQFGYVSTFREGRFFVETSELQSHDPAVEYAGYTGDVRDLAEMYNTENEGITGTFVRPTFTTNRRPKKFTVYRFDGGYVVCGRDGDGLQVADCAGPPEMVLDVCRQEAGRQILPRIEFVFLPPRSRLGEHIQRLSHSYRAVFREDGGAMIRMGNLHSCFEKLTPVLTRRLQSSGLNAYSGEVQITGEDESIVLIIESGAVVGIQPAAGKPRADHLDVGSAVARLVIGDTDPLRICRQHNAALSGAAAQLVPVLFPDQEPSTILWDRF